MLSRIKQYLTYDLWRIRAKQLPKAKYLGLRTLRIIVLSLREFGGNNCAQRASSLTFFSLLSIVPIFAMAFGVAKGFGLDKHLETRVMEQFHGQEEVITRLIQFAQAMLENTQGGVVAGIGVLFLFWTIIRMLSNIEQAFNQIWGVTVERTWGRKFIDYLSLFLICPILFILSSSLTVYVTTEIQGITQSSRFLGYFREIIIPILQLLPIVIIWGLLSFIYIFMPNTKVNFSSGILGGIVGGTIYHIVQFVYINFQIGVSSHGAVYGSFAALPLFLIWLQLSWLIVLYGGEIAFAHQHEETYEFEPDCNHVSRRFKNLICLLITQLCVKRFQKGETPLNISEISRRLDIPIRLIRQCVFDLEQAGVLLETEPPGMKEQNDFYVPARNIDDLTTAGILSVLEKHGRTSPPVLETEEVRKLNQILDRFDETAAKSDANKPLKDL